MPVLQQQVPSSLQPIDNQAPIKISGNRPGNYRSISIPKLPMHSYISTNASHGGQQQVADRGALANNYSQRLIERVHRDRRDIEQKLSKLTPQRLPAGSNSSSVLRPDGLGSGRLGIKNNLN